MKIVLITSGQPSLNPRLIKEADALTNAGHQVTVIYQYWNEWGTAFDKELLKEKKWGAYQVGGSPMQQRLIYWFSRLRYKLANLAIDLIGFKGVLPEMSIGRCTQMFVKKAKSIKADLYIGHNLAALPAVVKVAKFHRSKCGFDAEDLHRFETNIESEIKLKAYIENKYFDKVDYLTTSSPQIAKKYTELFPTLIFHQILNVFPKTKVTSQASNNRSIKLFWFSQTIGLSRGVQDVIKSLKIIEELAIEFHILGYLNERCKRSLDELVLSLNFTNPPCIKFYQPITASKIPDFASQFDIGMATEPGFSINNHLALSNKLFTYLQAGLAIVATETIAQRKFICEHSYVGVSYEIGNVQQLANILLNYVQNSTLLERHRAGSRSLFETTLNWNREALKFLSIVDNVLNQKI